MNRARTVCRFGLGGFAAWVALASAAHAQLALSYNLEAAPQRAEQTDVVVGRCAGFNWMTSIGACGRELLSRIAQGGPFERVATFAPAPVAGAPDLPDLGTPEREPRWLRSGGGREGLLANGKTADLLFRFGSKFRLRERDDGGWEYYRFTDTTYDSFVRNHGHKTVGVELFLPLQ